MAIRIVCVGDNVADCYSARDQMFPGGNCLNVSVFARRSGAETGYVGAIGPDAAGAVIRNALASEGVDISRLRTIEGATARCMIGHRNGDRVFVSSDLGVSMFEPDEGDLDFIATFDAVHVGQSSGLDSVLPSLASRSLLSYDFSTRRDHAHLATIASLCFLASFSGGDLDDHAARALATSALTGGAQWALVTRGPLGAILLGHSGNYATAAAPGDVVDTLGAGDTVIARTLVGLLRGDDVTNTLSDAAIRAAATCTATGAFGYRAPLSAADQPEAINPH